MRGPCRLYSVRERGRVEPGDGVRFLIRNATAGDLLVVGGGLAGGLIALAMAERRPDVRVTLLEAAPRLGGNHLWSFFDADVAASERPLLRELVACRWSGHAVRFPGRHRTIEQGYNSVESERLDAALRARLPEGAIVQGVARGLDEQGATLADGRRIEAKGVIDARGSARLTGLDLGWQKFAGQMLRLAKPHGLDRPVIMDATVAQHDGYRFVYLLPFGPDRVFVEDTYYSTDPAVDPALLGDRIAEYARAQGWRVIGVERQEAAALPIAMGGDFDRFWPSDEVVPRVGMAAGLFHAMTGYSLPDAVRTAALVAGTRDLSTTALAPILRAHAADHWRQQAYHRLLARMLFRAAAPGEGWRVLARFYGLDAGIIARFYAGRSTWGDKLRILAGKPPVPLGRAIGQLRERTT